MTITTLQTMPHAQARVITTPEQTMLKSYDTIVIIVDTAEGWVECTGTYSQTTRKHISAFCKEFGYNLTYQLLKQIFTDKKKYNIYTGEVQNL